MINKKIKVLLLSAPIGSGHRLAAEALKETFENKENISKLIVCEEIINSVEDKTYWNELLTKEKIIFSFLCK